MANNGEKSITMVQEMVIMLFFTPSFVVTRITGPGSISVYALLSCILFITAPPYPLPNYIIMKILLSWGSPKPETLFIKIYQKDKIAKFFF
jgi:hypothetical protein